MNKLFVCLFLAFFVCYSSAEVTSSSLRELIEWLGPEAYKNFDLDLFEGQGVGVVAAKHVEANEVIVAVPIGKALLNSRVAPLFGLQPHEPTGVEGLIMFMFAESARPDSQYRPYINSLPDDFSSMPSEWDDETFQYCEGTGLREHAKKVRNNMERSYERLKKSWIDDNEHRFPPNTLTFERFKWASHIVQTRTWRVTIDGKVDTIMVPVADMINHEPTSGVGFLHNDLFQIRAGKTYEAGEQMHCSYGPKNNFNLLTGYGFLLPNNPNNSVSLHFSFRNSTLVQSIAEPYLRNFDPNYQSVSIFSGQVPTDLLRDFRLSTLEFSELQHIQKVIEGQPVSLSNELKAIRSTRNALLSVFQAYPTTEAQDKELLARGNLTRNQHNALMLRITEREVVKENLLALTKVWENILLTGELMGGKKIE